MVPDLCTSLSSSLHLGLGHHTLVCAQSEERDVLKSFGMIFL